MATKYPNQIDGFNELPKVTDGTSPIVADDHNRLRGAIVAIETELGINPSGVKGTVKDRFDELNTSEVLLVNADGYFISTTLEGALSELAAAHINTNEASEIPIDDVDGYFVGTNVEDALAELASGKAVRIGSAEDFTYTDGLFVDFNANTRLGIAIDRFNEVLGSLAPPPAPNLGDMSYATSLGPEGNMSFGSSNIIGSYANVGTAGGGPALDINGLFTSASGAALRKGLYATGVNKLGILADSIPADTGSPTPSYPADAFGNADQGSLVLELNGVDIHTVDLTSFGSGSSLNGDGSGFTSLSVATSISFPSGDPLDLFKFRTGDWIIDSSETNLTNGWNYARVRHVGFGTTNYFEWVVDADVTATSFSGETLDFGGGGMTGSVFISGVEYHTGGTAEYDIVIDDVHRNTYSNSASAISHSITTNTTVASAALTGGIATQGDSETILNKAVTVSPDAADNRILNGSLIVNTAVDRTVQGDINSGAGDSITGILVDNNSDTTTDFDEPFSRELYRVASDKALTDITGYTTSGNDALWDQTESLVGADAGHNDGLLMFDGSIVYPDNTTGVVTGNFGAVANGPGANPNYTTATGERSFIRYFFFSSSENNFTMQLNGSGTVISAATGLTTGTDDMHVELLLPNTTQDGGATIEYKDCFIAFTTINNIGCFAATYGSNVGNLAGLDWGLTSSTRNTSTSGGAAVIRITVPQDWTGNLTNMNLSSA